MSHGHVRLHRQSREFRRPQSGFTAIEMMAAAAILAIVTSLALPSFADLVKRYRVRRAVEDFTAMLHLARVEGIQRGGGIVLARAAAADCAASGPEWSCGWRLFADADGDKAWRSGEEVIQHAAAPAGVRVTTAQGAAIRFDRWGQAGGLGVLSFHFQSSAPAAGAVAQAQVCVSGGGRIRVLQGVSSCAG
ncbi:MAG: GspH/FimT family protein [Xenophilus sp.]